MSRFYPHTAYNEESTKHLFSVTLINKPKQIRMPETSKCRETLYHFYNDSKKLIRLFMQAGLQARPKGLKTFFELTLQLRVALERGQHFTNPRKIILTEDERTRLMEENHDQKGTHADVLFRIYQTAKFLCRLYAITDIPERHDWHKAYLGELEELRDDLIDVRNKYPIEMAKKKARSQYKSEIASTNGVTSKDTMEHGKDTATANGIAEKKRKRETDVTHEDLRRSISQEGEATTNLQCHGKLT